MRLTSADLWRVGPGRVHLWTPRAEPGAGPAAPLSVNQANHLAAVAAGSASVWLGVAVQLPGWYDAAAARRVGERLVARHDSLQVAVRPGADETPVARRCPPGSVTLDEQVVTTHDDAGTGRVLREGLDRGCRPLQDRPALALAAVVHDTGTTLVAAFDHLHVDAVSLLVVLEELVALLVEESVDPLPLRVLLGDAVGTSTRLPAPGSFLDAVEQWAAAPPISPDDPRLRRWTDLLDDTGDTLPGFPFDLGLAPGEDAPQRTLEVDLADAAGAAALTSWAGAAGASTYAACLATLASACRSLGGPHVLPVLAPVQTRRAEDQRAVGWFTTTVPVLLPGGPATADPARADPCPAGAARALAAGLEAAALPLDQVLRSLPRPLVRPRADVFMVSYLDYRRLPGRALATRLCAAHVSSPTRCDDVQTWISRTDDGLRLRVRLPATAAADAAVGELLAAWRAGVRRVTTVPGRAA